MKSWLFYYCLVLTILLTLGAAFSAQTASVIPLILFLPVTVYFLSSFLGKINPRLSFPFKRLLSALDLYYGFIVVTIMTISGLIGAKNIPQLLSSIIFLPLAGYFVLQVLPKKKQAIYIPALLIEPKELKQKQPPAQAEKQPVKLPRVDIDRRQFLKLISSAGLALFLFSIFAKRAQAAFFGSVPGPGTVALKDISGAQIDPAIKVPTDGYKITQIDDSAPAYYGFVERSGKWFIMKEDSTSGAYRYTKGTSSFATNWTNRASLTYDYFNIIFP